MALPLDRTRYLLALLLVVVIAESVIIAFPSLLLIASGGGQGYVLGEPRAMTLPYSLFNQPISNDTEFPLAPAYPASWSVSVVGTLLPANVSRASEAEVAFAPGYPSENLSIPTMIIQERADGLLRIEYYAQDWANSYGLVLYNSTSPGWKGGQNVTVRFISLGQPSSVNPQLAPRPNGNLSIYVGGLNVLSDYPVAWANLSDLYVYGTHGSSFTGGAISLAFRSITR